LRGGYRFWFCRNQELETNKNMSTNLASSVLTNPLLLSPQLW
jgi:hypothetical protein